MCCIHDLFVQCSSMKIFSSLPNNIENLRNGRVQFKLVLTEYLISHSFYSHTDFFEHHKSST